MAQVGAWIAGARPRTLPASVAPVLAATGLAAHLHHAVVLRAILAAVVALALQVGVNYANDYSDGIRGTDQARVGPVRLVGQGLASPAHVRAAALGSFAVAAAAGVVVAAETSWWLLVIGASAIAAAWFYTGGPRPYGYAGLGELFAFAYFGLLATLGTLWIQVHALPADGWILAIGLGLAISAILMVNNVRDVDGDRLAGKHTLAVRLGESTTRALFVTLVAASVVAVALATWLATDRLVAVAAVAVVGLVAAPSAIAPVVGGAKGRPLVASLAATGRLTLVLGLAFALAAWLAA
ncbi:1,4-dihydroxy-2-naphthoateoctaprenyltransferase [Acidimicrobium ferrooxidans DSM 10331]|uniref:1,4-dihydroxy-2-naphthoate octaprenyltransferase n=1 Tax=Acidimicrobium ferrooxidans (strain DSM 10331 / JCM 15462 / NBRC 103882 / ICP) TaxID=525909 RepID=C7M0N6_ACIFD|nr:1,4-dihydroxy-2-naphthoate polyprenyltransferase [Acidimicrobium ferrooxidans]ACU54544.1 1,4-dihydroxy-2-naphthoateoctaprenyltransferase [Acidimicrobium ferrooxidans DSM 10331]